MGLLDKNKEGHVKYNGDETTLLDIKRRHIKENQTIYSGSYAIKNKPVQTAITSSVPLWQTQPARSEIERLIYVKNDILRQMMDWVGGDWVGSVDYGKNTIITYDAPDDLKQKTDWNENFDQAIADNFGMQLCTGDLPISIQMANYICWRENGLKFGDMDHQWKDTELNGYYMPMDHTSTPHKTYALGMMYTSMDGGETLTDIETVGSLDPTSIWNCWIGLAKYAAKDILKHCGSFTPNQNQLDSLVRRWYSAPASCYKICERLAGGESPDSVYANWIHFQDCTEKGNTAGHVRTYESQRPVMTRNCEECRNWFIGMYPEEIPGLGKFEEWTYGADMVGASGGGMSGGGMSGGPVPHITTPPNLAKHGFDVNKALGAYFEGKGICAKVTRLMMEAGGLRSVMAKYGHPVPACWYHTKGYLKKYGFTHITTLYGSSGNTTYAAQPGDVACMFDSSGIESDGHGHWGHICMYFGSAGWRSDFIQKGPNPYGTKHDTWIYRLL
jgi:hypothetical protein